MNYGESKCPPIEEPEPPTSPADSFRKAGLYLYQQQHKGFPVLPGIGEREAPHIYDKAFLMKTRQVAKMAILKENKDLFPALKVHKEDVVFMESRALKKVEKEIKSLPWYISDDGEILIFKLRDQVLSIAHAMVARGLFNEIKLNRRQLQRSTDLFVDKIYN